MTELLLSALIPIVLGKATDCLFRRIGDMWGISDQCERLNNMLLEIQAVVHDAEDRANSNPVVKSWLHRLKSVAYDVDDILDEFCYEGLRRDAVRRGHKVGNVSGLRIKMSETLKNVVGNVISAFFSRGLRIKMSEKLKRVVGRVDDLVVEMRGFNFVQVRIVQVADHLRTHSYVIESKVMGRENDRAKLVQLLLQGCGSGDLLVVPIVGMGGVGKTTLAQVVYNDRSVGEYFNLQLWLCVSKEFNIGYLVKTIINLVLRKECNLPIDNIELLHERLCQLLSGKRYVLVLDDVWNENVDEWERLRFLLNCGDSGSAIIVTTRSNIVASIMGTVESFNLELLSFESSLTLFHNTAFSRGVKEEPEMVEIGRKLVQNCGGLPLAIQALGSLMSYKFEVREWLVVLEQSMSLEQHDVLSVLRLSFNYLPSHMKQCFAFCAVYPKDYVMDKDKLIQFWIANGFIPSDGPSSLEMKGNDIFNELVSRSFFQKVGTVCPITSSWRIDTALISSRLHEGYCSEIKCTIHDLMHDLAQSVMGVECLSTSEVPAELNEPMINVRHISIKTPPLDINRTIYCFPSIRTLISSHPYGSNYVRNVGFLNSNSLLILELNVQPIEKTIFTPEKMKYLRYLELSIREITSLPEAISALYLLQTLRLSKCWNLQKLPECMRYMSSLRHLYISEHCYNLRSMPKCLGELRWLQILTTYIVGTDTGNDIGELKTLNLHGQLHLYNLRKIKHVVDARVANLEAKQNLDDLALCWGMPIDSQGFDHNIPESNAPEVIHCDPFEVLDALKPCNKLKVLEVTLYQGDKFPIWMTEYHMLENLIELYIVKCRECTKIPPVERLPLLRILKLKHLDNLRHICSSATTRVECGEDAPITFPSLKKMVLYEMPKLCSWCEGEVGNKSSLIFPVLTRLKVINCPKLTAMPIVPSLIIFRSTHLKEDIYHTLKLKNNFKGNNTTSSSIIS